MNHFKRAFVCFLGAIAMTGCAASENAGSVKGTLENNGYKVSVYNAEEYKKLSIAATLSPEGLTDHLVSSRSVTDSAGAKKEQVFVVWFFSNIDQATNFVSDKADVLYSIAAGDDCGMGSRNNAAWTGSKHAAKLLGWIAGE